MIDSFHGDSDSGFKGESDDSKTKQRGEHQVQADAEQCKDLNHVGSHALESNAGHQH